MLEKRTIQADHKGMLIEITEDVKQIVSESGIRSGIAVVGTPHVNTGILCTSFYDPKGHEDIIDDFTRIWPARDNFRFEGEPSEAAAHSKAAVAGTSMDFIVEDGELRLGGSQGIFFAEYCNPCLRVFTVKVFGN